MNIHNVSAIRLKDQQSGGHQWVDLTLVVTTPFSGEEVEFKITVFSAPGTAKPLRVEQPEEVSA
jgi:hypothetical protein